MDRVGVRRAAAVVVAAVSLFHLLSIAAWQLPSGYVRDQILRSVRRYVRVTKSDQYWAMFAPDPLSVNRRLIVKADLQAGGERETDMTTPVNQAMRGFSLARTGKTLKAHDRILSGDDPKYLRGYALYACNRLEARYGQAIRQVTLLREYESLTQEASTFKMTRSKTARATLATHACH